MSANTPSAATLCRRKYYKNVDDPVGLTARGTKRKFKFRPELAGLRSGTPEYHAAYETIIRAEGTRRASATAAGGSP